MANSTELLFGACALLPAGTDVFAFLLVSVRAKFFPSDLPTSFNRQLYAIIALLSLDVLLFAAAWAVRAWKTSQWVPFRTLTVGARRKYIVPHFVLSWQISSVVFLALLIPYAWIGRMHGEGKHVAVYMLWLLLVWEPIHCAAIVAVWSIAVALATSSHEAGRKERWYTSAGFLNTYFLTTISAGFVALLVSACIAQYRYDHLYSSYLTLHDSLAAFSSTFSPSTPSETIKSQLSTLIVPLRTVLHRQHRLDLAWRFAWALWTFRLFLLLAAFAFVAPRYFLHLSRELKTLSALSRDVQSSGHSGQARNTKRQTYKKRLRHALADMIFGSGGICFGAAVYAVISTALCVVGPANSNKSGWYQLFVLCGLYLSALIALPTSLLALHRALRHVPSSHPRNLTGTVITPHRPRDLIIVDNDDDGGGRGGGETWQDVSTVPVSAPVVDSGPASTSGGVRRSAATVEGVQVLREVLVACEEEMRAAAAEEGEKVKGEEERIEEV